MQEPNQNPPATVPEQPDAKPPLRKGIPLVIALVVIIALIGIAKALSLSEEIGDTQFVSVLDQLQIGR
jgi:hypothetical protein